jgi:ribonuclease P protein component
MERKQHMLVDKRSIDLLFKKGKSVKSFPLVMYRMQSDKNKVLFSVPKRNIKSAVNRNRIKRQLRAIYFKQFTLNETSDNNKTIAFVYISKTETTTKELFISMKRLTGII